MMFAPGRGRLSTSPAAIGSVTSIKTIGIVFGSVLSGYGGGSIGCDDHVNFKTHHVIGQGRESVELSLGVSIFESYVISFNIAQFVELPLE